MHAGTSTTAPSLTSAHGAVHGLGVPLLLPRPSAPAPDCRQDAANTIQRAWHGSQQRAADRRALEAATRACEAAEQDTAAVAMQRVWRGFAVRQENTAALLKAAQKRAEEENFAAIKIQSWWRMILGMKEALRLREERVNLKDDKVREDAACMIQVCQRCTVVCPVGGGGGVVANDHANDVAVAGAVIVVVVAVVISAAVVGGAPVVVFRSRGGMVRNTQVEGQRSNTRAIPACCVAFESKPPPPL